MYIVQPIPSAPLDSKRIQGLVLKSMQEVEKQMLADFHKTTETWTHKPNFEHHFTYAGGNAVIEVRTDDQPWNWLDQGTNVRYLQLPNNFKRKTSPGFLGSYPGTHLTKKYIDTSKPHDGITARKWSQMIIDKYDDILLNALENAIKGWWFAQTKYWYNK